MGPILQKNILITGASRGLGAALAQQLAGPQTRLLLWARDQAALEIVKESCTSKGSEVVIAALDLSDIEKIKETVFKLDTSWPIDTVYINAGLFDGARSPNALEALSSEMSIIDINVKAAIAVAHSTATCMRPRKSGHIIFISSLAGCFPLADAAAYSASKAGISAYAAALREKLLDDGITISDVRPGHIDTGMTKGHSGALPQLVSTDQAASIIINCAARRQAIISFPKPLSWLTTLSKFLPWRLRALFGKTQRFHIDK